MVRLCLSTVTIKKPADSLIVIAEKDAFRQCLIKNDSYNQNSEGFFDCELRKSCTGTAAGKYDGQTTLLKACYTPNVQVTENAAFDGWKGSVDIKG